MLIHHAATKFPPWIFGEKFKKLCACLTVEIRICTAFRYTVQNSSYLSLDSKIEFIPVNNYVWKLS